MYWYNVALKDDVSPLTAPTNRIYTYEVRIRGVDPVPTLMAPVQNKYHLGDLEWVKPLNYQCTSEFQEEQVTEVISPQSIVVNGVPSHIKGLQPRTNVTPISETDDDESSDDILPGQQKELDNEKTTTPMIKHTPRRPCLCCDQGSARGLVNE